MNTRSSSGSLLVLDDCDAHLHLVSNVFCNVKSRINRVVILCQLCTRRSDLKVVLNDPHLLHFALLRDLANLGLDRVLLHLVDLKILVYRVDEDGKACSL